MANTPNLITIWMSSRGKIFVIHTKIKSEPAGVDQEFWGEGGDLYLRVAQLMELAYKVLPFANWNLHVNIKNYHTRNTSNATK